MIDPFRGFILGVVQGLTEPIPVSSSAHLVLIPWLLGWGERASGADLTFDVALHMGTLAALLIYFWRDWWTLALAWLPGRASRPAGEDPLGHESRRALDRRLGIGLVLGTIPAALAGLLLEDLIESVFRSPVQIAVVLIAASAVFFLVDRSSRRTLGLESVTPVRALLVGLAQALALAPGVSRSGVTITAGLALGLTREAAARYAFLLAMPVTFGAGVFKLKDLARTGIPADERLAFAIGIATSFVVGLFAIGFLLRFLRRYSMTAFIVYRVALGALVLAVWLARPA